MTPPPLRSDFTGVFDVLTQSFYIFGGDPGQPLSCAPSGGAASGEFWRYTIACKYWSQLNPMTMPPARTGAASAHEGFPANRNRMIMFGGRGASGLLNDVWAFDFATQTWSQLMIMGTAMPSPREHATIVYNSIYDQMIVFGGNAGPDPAQPMLLNDIWMLDMTMDKNAWTQLPAMGTGAQQPQPRIGHVSVYDDTPQVLYVGFGQNAGGTYLRDMWAYFYDTSMMPPTGKWTLHPISDGPSARIGAGMANTGSGRIVLFGGRDQDLGPLNDIWNFSTGSSAKPWMIEVAGDTKLMDGGSACMRPSNFVTPVLTSPERRSGMLFAFGYPGFPYVVAGQGDCGDLIDVWTLLEGTGWLQLDKSTDDVSCARAMKTGCTSLCQ
jgi:hypothetical protein